MLLYGVLLGQEADGVVNLDRPPPLRTMSVAAASLNPNRTRLLLTTTGSLAACHYLAGVEVEERADEVVVVPRLGSKFGEQYGGVIMPSAPEVQGWCPQPGLALAMRVDLDAPLNDRRIRVLRCTGEGRGDCETVATIPAADIPVAHTAEVGCVYVELQLEVQRDNYDRLDRCHPDAVPMIGIWG